MGRPSSRTPNCRASCRGSDRPPEARRSDRVREHLYQGTQVGWRALRSGWRPAAPGVAAPDRLVLAPGTGLLFFMWLALARGRDAVTFGACRRLVTGLSPRAFLRKKRRYYKTTRSLFDASHAIAPPFRWDRCGLRVR